MEIKILDENTINKIAAGEVIERPASIVKELIENSIDADASKIVIEVEEGGKKLIKVSDNGIGMDKKNSLLCFKKHATSKIRNINELENLKTLGFRGEALSSICAVGRVEIITKKRGQLIGTKILIENGREKKILDIGCNAGTTTIVKDLFYNLPARKKFLKTKRTELANIIEQVTNMAIAYHEIYFKLLHNGKEILVAPKTSNLLDNIVNIFGKDLAKDLVPIEYKDKDIKIKGYISKTEVAIKNQKMQFFYVNKRYVKSYLISNIIKDVYRKYLPKDKFPIAFLFIEINPRLIDVNVHPTKRLIKFSNEKEIYNSIFSTLKNALQDSFLAPKMELMGKEIKFSFPKDKERFMVKEKTDFSYLAKAQKKILKSERMLKDKEKKAKIPEIEVICQFANNYIIGRGFRDDENLIIIDQHAVHEKIIYEQLIKIYDSKEKHTQNLLTPKILELGLKEKSIIEEYLDLLNEIGFRIEEFGGNSYIVKSVPIVMGRLESIDVIHEIIEDLLTIGIVRETSILKEKIAQIVACHSSVRAGDVLTISQMNDLINQLRNLDNPFNCPHGRPTIIILSKRELEKRFGRR